MRHDLKDEFKIGERVQLHPATDRWMRGDRYGTVVYVGRLWVKVSMVRSGQVIRVKPEDLIKLW
jgi:hypothetical protein